MGHTIDQWRAKVAHLVRDASGRDLSPVQIDEAGLAPAFADLATDYPYRTTVEVTSTGTAFLEAPAGWVRGRSRITGIEYPIGENPPSALDPVSWTVVRSPGDVAVDNVLLLDDTIPNGAMARVSFEAPSWPFPDDATADVIDDVGFEAVCALATAKCLYTLGAEAARKVSASLPTNVVGGTGRVSDLMEIAKRFESTYQRLLGLDASDRPERKRVGTIRLTVPS